LNFAVFSKNATHVSLVFFASGKHEPLFEIALDSQRHRTGDIWHVEVRGIDLDLRYGWRVDRQPVRDDGIHRFDPSRVLIDPYAQALTGGSDWGVVYLRAGQSPRDRLAHRRSLFVRHDFDWQGVSPPRIPLGDKVIYELHVRGFTRHPSSGVAHPGTYLGLVEKIPYLKELGVTTVELLPVYEFDENERRRVNPFTGEVLKNYWGYNPIGFFAPKAAYAARGRNGAQVNEFKTMVRELHRAGIEVFLDVVFNHTAEGDGGADSPTFSFRGLDNSVYYLLDPATGAYRNFSGCGTATTPSSARWF